jgi:sporulation protein YlmC with PRC-barrel domain
MCTHRLTRIVVAFGVFLLWSFGANYADAQTRRAVRRGEAPIPVQPAPAAVPQPEPAVPPPAAADPVPAAAGERIEAKQTRRGEAGRMIRGSELIGMSVWGRNRERLGTVKDFVVDYEAGGCPTLFFAMTPEISGWSGEYVIVPFDAFQIGYDERQRTDYFVLGVAMDNLRRAPHLEINRWNSLHDRQFFTNARHFYRQTERTAAKPRPDTGREDSGSTEEGVQQPPDRQRNVPAPPRTEPPSGKEPGREGNTGVSPKPQPRPPAAPPTNPPDRPSSGRRKPEPNSGKNQAD